MRKIGALKLVCRSFELHCALEMGRKILSPSRTYLVGINNEGCLAGHSHSHLTSATGSSSTNSKKVFVFCKKIKKLGVPLIIYSYTQSGMQPVAI
jgi:hypothetical protein